SWKGDPPGVPRRWEEKPAPRKPPPRRRTRFFAPPTGDTPQATAGSPKCSSPHRTGDPSPRSAHRSAPPGESRPPAAPPPGSPRAVDPEGPLGKKTPPDG